VPEGARRGCSPLLRVELSRARRQAGPSLEPRTALTRGRVGAGRLPGRGGEAWRQRVQTHLRLVHLFEDGCDAGGGSE
jgi:hypothetical protein